MADAPVIPMNGDRPRRRTGAGTRSVLAGADRASGERARRRQRTTPLLADRDGEATAPVERPTGEQPAVEQPPAEPALEATEPTKTAATPQATTKRAAARKANAKRAGAKQTTAKKTGAKQTTAEKAPAGKAPAVEAAKAPAGRASGKRAVAKQAGGRATAMASTAPRTAARPGARKVAAAPPVTPAPEQPARPREKPAWVVEAEQRGNASVAPGLGDKLVLAATVASQVGELLADVLAVNRRREEAEAGLAAALDFLARRLTGEYEVDEFGFDPDFAEAVYLNLLRPVYRRWFRVEVRGIENIPSTGGALIVANHSGTVPIDGLMTAVAVHDEHPDRRFLRTLGADLVFELPFVSAAARKGGTTLATNADAERLLREGNLVGVWPEGFKGIGKPFSERYKLQRFGRGGFVTAALRTGTPIIPCSIVGAEEIYPIVGDIPALARLLGIPYVPITPFFPWLGPLGAIPLPSKWLIEFGAPVPTAEYGAPAADDPMLVFDLTDRIRQTIQQTLYSLLVQRRSIFF